MRKLETTLITLAVVLGTTAAASGQIWDRDGDRRYRDSGTYSNGSSDYQQGYRDGARQAEHDLRRGNRSNYNQALRGRDRTYREGYLAGYDRMYSNSGNYSGRGQVYGNSYPNGPYGNGSYGNGPYNNGPYANGPYANGPYNNGPLARSGGGYQNSAYQIGFTDGLADGRSDRSSGHSFRPTQGDNFKHADRGYNSSMGDKQLYKDTYRQGYQAAYSQGYQGRR